MKRITTAIAAVGLLALGGCGASEDASEAPTSAETTAAESEDEFAQVGDTIEAGCLHGDCLGEFTVDEITLGGECKIVDDFLGAPEIPEGQQLLQITGVQTMTSDAKDPATGEPKRMMVTWPNVWDADNFRDTAGSLVGCVEPDGYAMYGDTSVKGEKLRIYGTFLVPEGANVLGIENSRFDLTKLAPPTSSASSPAPHSSTSEAPAVVAEQAEVPAPPPAAPAAHASPVEAPQNVAEVPNDFGEIPPGPDNPGPNGEYADLFDPNRIMYCDESAENTVFTDGSTGFTAECAVAIEAES